MIALSAIVLVLLPEATFAVIRCLTPRRSVPPQKRTRCRRQLLAAYQRSLANKSNFKISQISVVYGRGFLALYY
jgi:hypothetical protein